MAELCNFLSFLWDNTMLMCFQELYRTGRLIPVQEGAL